MRALWFFIVSADRVTLTELEINSHIREICALVYIFNVLKYR